MPILQIDSSALKHNIFWVAKVIVYFFLDTVSDHVFIYTDLRNCSLKILYWNVPYKALMLEVIHYDKNKNCNLGQLVLPNCSKYSNAAE